MNQYLEVPWPGFDRSTVLGAVRWGSVKQGLETLPALRWFKSAAELGHPASWSLGSFSHDVDRGKILAGYVDRDPATVWIRDGLSRADMLVTLFHELKHLGDRFGVEMSPTESRASEAEAESWGRANALAYLTELAERPTAIKSALLARPPAVRFIDPDRMLLEARVPIGASARKSIEAGQGMFETQPVLFDSRYLKAQHIGQVADLGVSADGEHLWFKAQLNRAAQYAQYVKRLIEQGHAAVRPEMMSYLADRSMSSPIVAATLTGSPVAA